MPQEYTVQRMVEGAEREHLEQKFDSKQVPLAEEAMLIRGKLGRLRWEEYFVQVYTDEMARDATGRARMQELREAREKRRQEQEVRQRVIDFFAGKYSRAKFRVREKDYKRGNPLDNYVRNHMKTHVVETFQNRCAACGATDDLVLDHWGIPKNEGGNFILFDADISEFLMNVAIFCNSCNSQKGEKRPYEVLTEEQVEQVEQTLEELHSKMMSDSKLRRTLAKWYDIDLLELFLVD